MMNFDIKIERYIEKDDVDFTLIINLSEEALKKLVSFSRGLSITEVDFIKHEDVEIVTTHGSTFGDDFCYQFFTRGRGELFIQISGADYSFQEVVLLPTEILENPIEIMDGYDFEKKYEIIPFDEGEDVHPVSNFDYVFEYWKENPRNVWTLLDGDCNQWAVAGLKRVNRYGFLITKEEWESEDELYLENDTYKIL